MRAPLIVGREVAALLETLGMVDGRDFLVTEPMPVNGRVTLRRGSKIKLASAHRPATTHSKKGAR